MATKFQWQLSSNDNKNSNGNKSSNENKSLKFETIQTNPKNLVFCFCISPTFLSQWSNRKWLFDMSLYEERTFQKDWPLVNLPFFYEEQFHLKNEERKTY